jgi:hypothetical protein
MTDENRAAITAIEWPIDRDEEEAYWRYIDRDEQPEGTAARLAAIPSDIDPEAEQFNADKPWSQSQFEAPD